MKITVTFQTSRQTSPYDYEGYTEVIHLDEKMTLKEVREKIPNPNDMQLHFED